MRQKKDLFLNVRSEIEQLHDLGHAGSRHPAEAGQFGIVPNRFLPQQSVKPDGECHEPGDPGNGAASRFASAGDRTRQLVLPPARSASAKIECVGDLLVGRSRCAPPAPVAAMEPDGDLPGGSVVADPLDDGLYRLDLPGAIHLFPLGRHQTFRGCASLSRPRTDSSMARAGSDFAGHTAQPLRCAFRHT